MEDEYELGGKDVLTIPRPRTATHHKTTIAKTGIEDWRADDQGVEIGKWNGIGR